MKTLTVTAENMPWIDRFCRNGLIDTLQKLHTGSLEIVEGDNTLQFGKAGSDMHSRIEILDSEAYRSIALNGSVGAGESYMTGDWTCSLKARLAIMPAATIGEPAGLALADDGVPGNA